MDNIVVKGARHNNLRNIDVTIPRRKMTVVTGPSGSGKSTLAFDVVYAEAQRRYIEALSVQARRTLDKIRRPDVDRIDGLCPALGIRQFIPNNNPRSTVGTASEVHNLCRVLFAAAGQAFCPGCGEPLKAYTVPQMVAWACSLPEGQRFMVAAPLVRGKESDLKRELRALTKDGFARVRIDEAIVELSDVGSVNANASHDLDVIVDRLTNKEGQRARITEAVELALKKSGNSVLFVVDDQSTRLFNTLYCEACDRTLPDPTPSLFSFNEPAGACSKCKGLGEVKSRVCDKCEGTRLSEDALAFRIDGHTIGSLGQQPLATLVDVVRGLELDERLSEAVHPVRAGLCSRAQCLTDVGLGYLTLGRGAATLSAGESQRLQLATQIGSGLLGMLYVLDEPTAGLHPADVAQLLSTLRALVDRGNTLLAVEHEPSVMLAADYIVDLGPGAGEQGGRVVDQGRTDDVQTQTLAYARGEARVDIPTPRRQTNGVTLELRGANTHNLKGVDVAFPTRALTCVTGVSGSGKSSLVLDTLAVAAPDLGCDRVIVVDGSPIGRHAKSIPATYVSAMTPIRTVFSQLPEARARGYKPTRFSFSAKPGRCDACAGDGVMRLSMHLLPDAVLTCEQCKGARYNDETLSIRYRGANIADVLSMRVSEALAFFEAIPNVRRPLFALDEVGLGYLELGRPATTLSGGEAQRIKIAKELGRKKRDHTLYILDEPTRGLHFKDVEVLLKVLHRLPDEGHTVVVVEHHLDVIASADHVIELGPVGGPDGGHLIFEGTPEQLAADETTATGPYLRQVL